MEGVPGQHDDPGHGSAGGAHRAAGGALTTPGPVELRVSRLDGPEAAALVAELDADLARRYDDDTPVHAAVEEFEAPDGLFVIADVAGVPLACAGFRRVDATTAELKRMYVRPAGRGSGLARRLLAHLETAARQAGYRELRLETGLSQPEAMALYESAGYRPIPGFGQFSHEPDQRCYAKSLEDPSRRSRAPLS